jgi:hypothetical protein
VEDEMKKVFEINKELKQVILTTKEEKALVRMIFNKLDKHMVKGYDDFFNHECIDVYQYDKIKKWFGRKPREK